MRQKSRWPGARLAGVALLVFAMSVVPVAGAQTNNAAAGKQAGGARAWIQRMNQALVTRNYDGVFKLRFGDAEEVFRIVHRVQDGEMTERVISTDGSGYEQKRKGSTWAQFFPDRRRVEVSTRYRSFGFIPALNGLDGQSLRHYELVDAGPASLLSRDVQLVRIEARDALRYGYHFWLDRQSGLPLKFQRVTHDGKVVKEMAFISPPSLPESISDDELKVAVDTEGFRWISRDRRAPMHNPELKRAYAPQAALLPPGYRSRIFSSQADEARANGPRARFIVSDGVSWAEVFLAPAAGEGHPPGGMSMGPMATYQLRLDDVQVTVVGEMPQAAAKAIAEAVRPE